MKKRLFVKIFTGYLVIILLVVSVMGYLTASNLKSSLTGRIEGELAAPAVKFYKVIFQTILIVLAPSIFLAIVFFIKIASPIREIEEYTRKVRENDKQAKLTIDSDDEIGSLSSNINSMIKFQQEKINQLREEKDKLESIFASMMEGVMVLNSDNKIEACNNSMMKIVGPIFHDIIGKTPIAVLRSAALQDALNYFLETGEPVAKEISIEADDPVILEVSISAIRDLPGDERKIMMVFHDVTQMRKLERIRSDFVANVTHEIKTPLATIIGFVQTLQEGAMDDQAKAMKFLRIISEHALRLNRLVDDLLTLSSIELGKANLSLSEIDVRDAISKAIAIIEEKAKEKNLAIRQDCPDNLPAIMADADSIVQILVNLLDNAVKFTPSGSITISTSSDGGYVAVKITDTGIGIPRQELSRLGERFYRVDRARSRELGGTGLGLSIVKHLLKAQNGRMEVESKPGAGTAVKIFLPRV